MDHTVVSLERSILKALHLVTARPKLQSIACDESKRIVCGCLCRVVCANLDEVLLGNHDAAPVILHPGEVVMQHLEPSQHLRWVLQVCVSQPGA